MHNVHHNHIYTYVYIWLCTHKQTKYLSKQPANKQNKTKQNKTKQNKTKQNKTTKKHKQKKTQRRTSTVSRGTLPSFPPNTYKTSANANVAHPYLSNAVYVFQNVCKRRRCTTVSVKRSIRISKRLQTPTLHNRSVKRSKSIHKRLQTPTLHNRICQTQQKYS